MSFLPAVSLLLFGVWLLGAAALAARQVARVQRRSRAARLSRGVTAPLRERRSRPLWPELRENVETSVLSQRAYEPVRFLLNREAFEFDVNEGGAYRSTHALR